MCCAQTLAVSHSWEGLGGGPKPKTAKRTQTLIIPISFNLCFHRLIDPRFSG